MMDGNGKGGSWWNCAGIKGAHQGGIPCYRGTICDSFRLSVWKSGAATASNEAEAEEEAGAGVSGCSKEAAATHELTDKVFACEGSWTEPGVQAGAEQLCGAGLSLCGYAEMEEVPKPKCEGLQGFYATQVSSDGNWACNADNTGTNDLWGCGDTGVTKPCGKAMPRAVGNTNIAGWTGLNSGSTEKTTAVKTKDGGPGGVICCISLIQNPAENERKYSSVFNNDNPGNGYAQSMLDSPQAWSAGKSAKGQWAQLDLGSVKAVDAVVMQPRKCCGQVQRVNSYTVKVSTDEST